MTRDGRNVTADLAAIREGDPEARERVYEATYAELRSAVVRWWDSRRLLRSGFSVWCVQD